MPDITLIVGIVAALSGIVLGWSGHSATRKRDTQKENKDREVDVKAETRAFTRVELMIEDLSKSVGEIKACLPTYASGIARHDQEIALIKQRLDAIECRPIGRRKAEAPP